jgi:hypothetical protein
MTQIVNRKNNFILKTAILEGESIRGYISRVRYFSSNCGVIETEKYLEKNRGKLAWQFPTQLAEIADFYAPASPAVEDLIRNHTIFPLFTPFLSRESSSRLWRHFSGKAIKGVGALTGLNHKRTRSKWHHAICTECVAGDNAKYGFAFWRNAHFVPSLSVCIYHKVPLKAHCDACIYAFRTSRKIWEPTDQCPCGGTLKNVKETNTKEEFDSELLIAEGVKLILGGAIDESISNENVLTTIHFRSLKLGLRCKKYSKLNSNFKELIPNPGILAHHNINEEQGGCFRLAIQGRKLYPNPIRNIVIIIALFGTFQEFIKQLIVIKLQKLFDGNDEVIHRQNHTNSQFEVRTPWVELDSSEREFLILKLRTKVHEIQKIHLDLTRSKLREILGYCHTNILHKFDRPWLNEHLKAKWTCHKTITIPNTHNRDISLSQHIYTRHKILIRSRVTGRISYRKLVEGHIGASYSKKKNAALELATTALKECEESNEQWRYRSTLALIGRIEGTSMPNPFSSIVINENMTSHQYKCLWKRLNKWLIKNEA